MPFTPTQALTVVCLPGISRKTAVSLLQLPFHGSGPDDLYGFLTQSKPRIPELRAVSKDQVNTAFLEATACFSKCVDLNLALIPYGNPNYPERLVTIPDPPAILYVKGRNEALKASSSVAIVGTRTPTTWGQRAAQRIAERMVEAGFSIVSGLAKGCDTAAHRGCLNADGTTVAVLAHGLHTIYPSENRALANDIVEQGGCLVSEYPPGTGARPHYFIERDRIQSGLSLGTIVVETDVQGGTMHTVRACRQQGRVLACVVHPPAYQHEKSTKGNQLLLSNGSAVPLQTGHDLLRLIEMLNGTNGAPMSNPIGYGQS